ncbi:MAG: MFS transporter [Deltaproteobacteria bacterium]|nr:MAG: MFS transporter [Deltaproteobacteria bacterium]
MATNVTTAGVAPGIVPQGDTVEARAYSKVTWRLLPFLFACYVFAYLDRVNVGFAKLQMLSDLKFSETVYGLGAGIFFIGYFLFEVPSNLIMYRVGARVWIGRIMITWGILAGLMMIVRTPTSFYILRFLLGAAEAGFIPGILLYLTYWYPAQRRGRVMAFFLTGIPISGVVGGPLSGWIMQTFQGVNGWAGWQWLFLLEALPAFLAGVVALFYLTDDIHHAKWLSEEERRVLQNAVKEEAGKKEHHSMKDALNVGLLTAIPYGAGTIAMIWVSHRSDDKRERRWHLSTPGILGALGLALSTAFSHNTALSMLFLTIGAAGVCTTVSQFWNLPGAFLGGAAAAAGIAFVNSVGNISGFVAPYMVGWIKDATGSASPALWVIAASMTIASLLVFRVPAQLVNK